MPDARAHRRSALTLIELLVVIAIIAVLAGMLLPALAAARERTRRVACLHNLSEFGKALALYAEGHNDYFPCTPGWGHMELPGQLLSNTYGYTYSRVVDGRMQSVRSATVTLGGASGDVPSASVVGRFVESFYGVIACAGTPTAAAPALPANRYLPGAAAPGKTLSAIPVGIGILYTSGYLPELRVFYCPSASIMSPPAFQTGNAATDLKLSADASVVRYLPGKGPERLLTGGWSTGAAAIACSYAYRNQPVMAPVTGTALYPAAYGADGWRTALQYNGGPGNSALGPPYTERPQRLWDNGCAITSTGFVGLPLYVDHAPADGASLLDWPWPSCFRSTTKLLDERALLVDRWGKCNTSDCVAGWPKESETHGDGYFAHRQGYNVLYGSGACRWFSDPEEQMVRRRHTNVAPGEVNASNCAIGVLPGVTEWRLFDRAAGLDGATTIFQACDNPSLY